MRKLIRILVSASILSVGLLAGWTARSMKASAEYAAYCQRVRVCLYGFYDIYMSMEEDGNAGRRKQFVSEAIDVLPGAITDRDLRYNHASPFFIKWGEISKVPIETKCGN